MFNHSESGGGLGRNLRLPSRVGAKLLLGPYGDETFEAVAVDAQGFGSGSPGSPNWLKNMGGQP